MLCLFPLPKSYNSIDFEFDFVCFWFRYCFMVPSSNNEINNFNSLSAHSNQNIFCLLPNTISSILVRQRQLRNVYVTISNPERGEKKRTSNIWTQCVVIGWMVPSYTVVRYSNFLWKRIYRSTPNTTQSVALERTRRTANKQLGVHWKH